jgi:hypothetical protein
MRRLLRVLVPVSLAAVLLALPLAASAGHEDDPRTDNLRTRGHIEEPASLLNPAVGNINVHTDIAFWGRHAFQGTWNGFNIRNIRNPDNPTQVSFTDCPGPQGDVVVWDDILVRTWDAPAGTPGPFGAGLTCDGQPVPQGWEGVHVFDISNKLNPVLVASVQLACGSHTASGVPDLRNDRLLVYSSSSAHSATNPNPPATCDFFDIIDIPLDRPEDAELLRSEPSEHTCHDIGVILGNVRKAACAGGEGVRVFSLGGRNGGSLDNPRLLFHTTEAGVTVGHSAAWSWDGKVIIFGHEPGGGVQARCGATDPPVDRTMFFYDGRTGAKLGQWTLPRTQSATENCTIHNYNVVPLRSGRDIVVHGSYQSGTSAVDFTNPANAREIAWSDPPPIVPQDLGGAWSSYWYNGLIYETNITEGLNIFQLKDRKVKNAKKLGHLNPQTQEFSLDKKR